MSNILRVARNIDFHQLIRVSDAILHSHSTMVVQARGKQIQRAIEVMCVLQVQSKASFEDVQISYIVVDNGSHIPSFSARLKSILFDI